MDDSTREIVKAICQALKEQTSEVVELVETGREAITVLAKEAKPLFDGFMDYVVERNIKSFDAYVEAGMSQDNAAMLVCANLHAMRDKMNSRKK